jgi:hypothetical protein
MDHNMVVREKITEKYLLAELAPGVRDEFEEHFFTCPECARDIRAGSEFVERSKIILAEDAEPVVFPAARPSQSAARGWFAWFRPAFAVPAIAVLLLVIAYQNFVTLPQLTQAGKKPQVLPAATVNLLTYGANASPLIIHAGDSFLINVIIPPGHSYAAYKVDLYNPSGALESSVPIPASADDTWPIRFPEANRQSGTYKLTVHGISADGHEAEVGNGSFALQVQK